MKGRSGMIRPLWPQDKDVEERKSNKVKSSHLVTLTASRTLEAGGACMLPAGVRGTELFGFLLRKTTAREERSRNKHVL